MQYYTLPLIHVKYQLSEISGQEGQQIINLQFCSFSVRKFPVSLLPGKDILLEPVLINDGNKKLKSLKFHHALGAKFIACKV